MPKIVYDGCEYDCYSKNLGPGRGKEDRKCKVGVPPPTPPELEIPKEKPTSGPWLPDNPPTPPIKLTKREKQYWDAIHEVMLEAEDENRQYDPTGVANSFDKDVHENSGIRMDFWTKTMRNIREKTRKFFVQKTAGEEILVGVTPVGAVRYYWKADEF